MRKKIIIIGAGGHGRVIADIVRKNGHEVIGFLDDNETLSTIKELPILGKVDEVQRYIETHEFVVGIGNAAIINTGAIIDHDNQIGDYVHVCPGANLAGTVQVCEGTWIGVGASVTNNIRIAGGCCEEPIVIGAGAVVVKNINDTGIYTGVPAKKV